MFCPTLLRPVLLCGTRNNNNRALRTFSSNNSNTFKTLRLYRILLRTLRAFDDDTFLLRPRIYNIQTGMYLVLDSKQAVLSLEDYIIQQPKIESHHQSSSGGPLRRHPLAGMTVRVLGVRDDEVVSTEEIELGDMLSDDDEPDTETKIPQDTQFRPSLWARKSLMQATIKNLFRHPKTNSIAGQHSLAISANVSLARHAHLWKQTSINEHRHIHVTAVGEVVDRDESRVRYGYRIRVENRSDCLVQLTGRTWRIYPNSAVKDVCVHVDAPHGGAVGQYPILRNGQVFEYQSAAEAGTNGKMEGSMHFKVVDSGEEFEVPIVAFPLRA